MMGGETEKYVPYNLTLPLVPMRRNLIKDIIQHPFYIHNPSLRTTRCLVPFETHPRTRICSAVNHSMRFCQAHIMMDPKSDF
jgi:hypothetical protein